MVFYSFDTSSIMNGRRDLLPPAVFHTLWSNIETMIAEGHLRAVDVVKDELSKRDDDASRWANNKTGYSCRWKPTFSKPPPVCLPPILTHGSR